MDAWTPGPRRLFYTEGMQLSVSTYIPGDSPVHRQDARVKILLLLAYSIALFFIDTWWGMACAALLFAVVFAISGLPARQVLGLIVPIYVLAALTVVFNMFIVQPPEIIAMEDAQDPSRLIPLIGWLCLSVPGLLQGCFFACRILLLVYASLIVCFTSTSTQLTDALRSFLAPLRLVYAPVDDIATVFSIAIRFIPVTAEEFCRIRNAQWSRGSRFDTGGVAARLRAWQTVLIPLFVGLFRRADTLAVAMDARCYGTSSRRTSLSHRRFGGSQIAVVTIGFIVCIALAALL